jgi:AraC-like DNA-binding protein
MDTRIAEAIVRMENTLEAAPGVPDLAASVQLSPSRFAHLFRAETGVPPGRYLHTMRMQRARVLLERTFLTVREVMVRVGSRDPSHFSRDFRRFHGVPPSAVRGDHAHPGPAPAALLDHLVAAERQPDDKSNANLRPPAVTPRAGSASGRRAPRGSQETS